LFETDEFDYLLGLRCLGEYLFIFDFLDIFFFFNVGIEVFEEQVLIIYRFDPYLVAVAFIVIELRV
jgi:hypothetical protein